MYHITPVLLRGIEKARDGSQKDTFPAFSRFKVGEVRHQQAIDGGVRVDQIVLLLLSMGNDEGFDEETTKLVLLFVAELTRSVLDLHLFQIADDGPLRPV